MNTKYLIIIKLSFIRFITILIMFSSTSTIAVVLEEVVVTAQKREQNIQDVGIAITAFSGEQMKALGFERSIDVAGMSPGVYLSGDTGGHKTNFTIRGVVQNSPEDVAESPIAVYIDEGYVAALNGQIFGLWDIDRVEVAKGPQGTLFGRNATGGLVHFISRKPTDEFEAYTDLTYGSYDQVRVEGAVSGPVTENLTGRISGFYNRHDPIYENIFPDQAFNFGGTIPGAGQDLGNDDTWGVRGHALFKPNNDVEILLSGYGTRSVLNTPGTETQANISIVDAQGRVIGGEQASSTEVREGIGPGGVNADVDGLFPFPLTRPVPGGDYFGFKNPEGPDVEDQEFIISQDFAFEDTNILEGYGGAAKISWDLDRFTLTSITDVKLFDKFVWIEPDATATDWFMVAFDVDSETIAQEIRLNGATDRARWVTGLYYLHYDNKAIQSFLTQSHSFLAAFGLESDIISRSDVKTNSYSVFGQVDYDLSDTLTLIGGLRIVREEKDLVWTQGTFLNEDDFTIDTNVRLYPGQPPDFITTNNATLWTGKLQLDWRPNNDLLIYGGVNRGIKAGGFNNPLTFTGVYDFSVVPYQEEVLLSYEAGFKSTLFGGTTRFNTSFYYYDYSDYQVTRWANNTAFIVNVDATNYGVEMELISSPAPGWDVMLTLGLLESKINDVEIAPGVFRNVNAPYSPGTTLGGLARYEWPEEVLGGKISTQMDFNYVSRFYSNLRNFDSQHEDSYVVGNARVGWNTMDGTWETSFFVKNIADARYNTINFDNTEFCGCSQNIMGNPRWFGGSIRYNWQ